MNETVPAADVDDRGYFTAIETEFIRRRGSPFLLSPKDYAVIRRWRELGIPVEDVCLGIAEAFDRRAERGAVSRINSVSYCEGAVLEAWERGASTRVGKNAAQSEESDVPARLDGLATALSIGASREPGIAAPLESAARRIRKLAGSDRTPEQIESSLTRIEKKLLNEISDSLPDDARREIDSETDRRLARDRERMESRALQRTREILIRRSLRARLDLPRLSLLG